MTRRTMTRLPAEEKSRAVEWMAGEIRKAGEFEPGQRYGNALELHRAAVAATLKLIELASVEEDAGVYIPEEEMATLVPLVLLGKGRTAAGCTGRRRARVLAHEHANHLMRTHVAPRLYGVEEVVCTAQDNRTERHRMACRVEDQVVEQRG